MKAFLLAAGDGTRLRPLTNDVPKCLLPIQGVPLLEIWLENCRAGGINEVLINVHSHAEKIREFVSRHDKDLKTLIAEERELLGSAGTIKANREFVSAEEAFFVLYADVLTNINLTEMLAFHRCKGMAATLGTYQVPDPTRCGIVVADQNDIIQQFVEKPAYPQSSWAFSGVMIAHPQVIDLIPDQIPADIGFNLLPKLVGTMTAYRVRDYLLDIGTPENYVAAQSEWRPKHTINSALRART